ncbi:putative two-component response-regulatory protein YehT [Desulfosporosinus acididurans]|uniref:Stage 0 sporulation protein A homolog n=1 Tax=Desulfosporosinus acididurans TaxID=476652 RepID=A0A0J1FSV2_9FIRM|nr:response regulator [Desulfosporosinus acididurans]KLU66387.1 putative two-component response-regulatory protein YehT [Desulfosporosinus acididurans]
MNYIIADPDSQNSLELKKLLDGCEILDSQGMYPTFSAAEKDSLEHPPDIAFIRLGKAELNGLRLAVMIRERNPLSQVIFISSQKEDAVEAFEYEADGFLLMPFSQQTIGQLLRQAFGRKK